MRGFRDDVCIATKVGVAQEGVRFDPSPRSIQASCEMSLERLGTDYIDLYQVHFDDGRTPTDEVVAAMESLKGAGKIREWGVCHLPAVKISEYCRTGKTFSVLMELSAVARSSREDLLPVCEEHGVAGIAFSTTGRGILTGSIRPGHVFPEGDLRSYDPLFQREQLFQEQDEWIEGQRRKSVFSILKTPVKPSPREAFADLVYVLEVSVSLGLIDEQAIIPIFQCLYELKGEIGKDVSSEMDKIRHEVARMLPGSYLDA